MLQPVKNPMARSRPLIPCSEETRALVREQKRAGETYDSLLRKMVQQYRPDKAPAKPLHGDNKR